MCLNTLQDLLRSTSLEATARGAATIAGLEIGVWHSLDDIGDLWRFDHRFEPDDPVFVDSGYGSWLRAVERA